MASLGGDLGRAAYGAARADGTRGQSVSGGSRQPVDQIGRKGGGSDDKVGYDAGKKVKGQKIHTLVDSEGLPMRVVVTPPQFKIATGPVWCSTRSAAASHGSN